MSGWDQRHDLGLDDDAPTLLQRFADRFDHPDFAVWILTALGVLLVALAVLSIVDMDDTRTNEPAPPATVYEARP